ncbi:LamG domain-containing protein, partial [bacterium]|nr:LamG domain-containing protein [bacterium]
CVYAYANAAQAGTFYMDTIYIDTVGTLMVDMLAAKNGTYGLSIPAMDTTARYGSFTNPTAETAVMAECWFDPNTITMAANDEYVFMWAEGNKFAISVNYSGGYRIRASATKDAGSEETAYYSITDAPHYIRIYWGASTADGDDNGFLYLYIDHVLQEALTGLDNDTVSVGNVYVGNTGVDSGTYGIFYLDDCKWGPWIDITSDVIGDITGNWGMVDNDPLDLLADTGVMKIVLNNESGDYLPGLANALDGFKKGTPVRLRFNYSSLDYIRFYGTIDTLEPDPGAYIVDKVTIEVTDWMDYAATHPLLAPSLGTDQRADEMITTLVADMPIAPLATDYDTGVNTFPTSFDNVTTKTKAYTELNKIILSELGYGYLQKDPVYGETLVFEGAEYRNGLRTPDFTSDNTMFSLEVEYGENVINRFINKVYPRRIDAAPVVLFETEARQRIPSGQTIIFRGNYTDPDGGGTEVSGKDMVTPVITTDYTAKGNRDGSGGNYTADLTVGVDKGTEGTTFTLTNGAATTAWVWIRIRGYGIYFYNPIENAAEDSTSYDEFGYISAILNQKYQDDLTRGALAGAAIIEQEKQPRTKLNKVSFVANRTDALMLAWLTWDVGNMCYLKNTDYNIDKYAYIQGVTFIISPGGLVKFSWIVKGMLSLLLGLSLISCEFDPLTTDGVNYGFLPDVFSDDTGDYISVSSWIYADTLPGAVAYYIMSFGTNSGGFRFYIQPDPDDDHIGVYSNLFDVAPGTWKTTNACVGAAAWYNVIITYDMSNVALDPIVYVGGVAQALDEDVTPAGAAFSRDGNSLVIGNVKTATEDYFRPFDGLIKDVRVYNVILTQAEATSLAAGGNVTRGMVFQGPCVRTDDLDYFEDRTLTSVDRLIDNMFGCVGTPNNTVITRLIP